MKIQRREVLLGALAAGLGTTVSNRATSSEKAETLTGGPSQPAETIDLWPGEAPGMPALTLTQTVTERSTDVNILDRAVTGITRPRLAIIRPTVPNGAAIMLIPGGGYERVTIDKEGFEPGNWFSERGYTVFVLIYRLPGDGWAAGPDVALSDAQRAIRLVRNNNHVYDVDPDRLAVMGFSAGGHLCADLVTRYAAPTYEPVDDADSLSARPSLAALIYPVISMSLPVAHARSRELLIGKDAGPALESAHSPQNNVPAGASPCFLVHAEDDPSVPVENALEFRAALLARGIPVETHLFARGGHGFGMSGVVGMPAAAWPELFLGWSTSHGLI